jgi:hypothetical protein|tara:strand:- start:249 stop:437 length:189 start_codon:yes stop_codon:yes gene_type:complete
MESFLLSLDRKRKIRMLEDALKEDKWSIFKEFSKILLDSPVNEGGLETEVVEGIFRRYQKSY